SKITSRIYMGNLGGARDFEGLLKRGITTIVNCTKSEKNMFFPGAFDYIHIPVGDSQRRVDQDIMKYGVYELIQYFCENPKSVLFVHCAEGISRSATVVLMLLAEFYVCGRMDALRFLQSKRSCV
ncbi:protein-tyrosine phosphatase-like protein, partial [Polychytrium aggregatum]|uniref:protein-tyrosine phosphatase-like protein n=1 Tax=Polychytrium aggregatum TaxID=110093 RepID=UPI0022FEA711